MRGAQVDPTHVVRARQEVLLPGRAQVRHDVHLPVDYAERDEAPDEASGHLCTEGRARGEVQVVRELLVLHVQERLDERDPAVDLELGVSDCIVREPTLRAMCIDTQPHSRSCWRTVDRGWPRLG